MQANEEQKQGFYVIEGIDGSGKSTLAQSLSLNIKGLHYETPSNLFKPSQSFIDRSASAEAQFLFYLSANVQVSNDIAALRGNQPVVCVRYIYSTIAYHVAKGLSFDKAMTIANLVNLETPVKIFLLDVSEPKQIERLSKRGFSEEDKRNFDKMARIRENYRKLVEIFPNFLVIDTDNLVPGEVLRTVLNYL